MEGINIWSGSDIGIGAALTNPTELAFRKGNIKNRYPVTFRGVNFRDAESAYQEYKSRDMHESYWYLCRSFKIVKFLFEFFTNEHKFDFPKIRQYTYTEKMI